MRPSRVLAATAFAAAALAGCGRIAEPAGPVEARAPETGLSPPPVAAAAAAPAAPARAAVGGLTLYGVSGSGSAGLAVLGREDGAQRIVAVGREFLPGVTLAAVGLDHATVVENRRPYRLELRRYAAGRPAGIPLGEARSSEAEQRLAAVALRSELSPVESNGRVAGHSVRRASNLPRLREAGIRDGDVILSVNGSQFDQERMSELVWELNNASKAEFVLMRDGKKLRISV